MQAQVKATFGSEYREVDVGDIATLSPDAPFRLDCGAEIQDFPIAYKTYGTLNEAKSNAILVCHGLTGDQYLAEEHPVTGKPGWWEGMVGPGKPIDTDTYFVIASNVLGSCMGSFGPKHENPATGKPYGVQFPVLTIGDMVRTQALLVKALGIEKLYAVVGGSMGGMLTLEWAASFPEKVHAAVVIASAAKHSTQNIAFHEIGRQAIMADPDWCEGKYLEEKKHPAKGLAVARMTAHVTYVSEHALGRKFGRDLQDRDDVSFGFEADFQVESYLRHQGKSFVDRFDANSYLYITRAMDYFDLAARHDRVLAKAFEGTGTRFCIVAFSSDWLFPPSESKAVVHALNAARAQVSYAEIETDKGHDAFLLDVPEFKDTVRGFLAGVADD
jgi:homoserine O-acetyltransferase